MDNFFILGVSAFYHNSAACIINNGNIIAAAEEERFSRIKQDKGFPGRAINYCLEEAGIDQHDLSAIVYYDNPYLTLERLIYSQVAVGEKGLDVWLNAMPSWVDYKLHIPQMIRNKLVYDGQILFDYHHRSHAASAFYPSPFKNAAVLTIDGVGEWSTASIGIGNDNKIQMLKEMRFPNSLGLLYSAFTYFTGFKVNSGEYKLMGLAPYGEPKYLDTLKEHIADLKEDGSVELYMDKFAFLYDHSMINEKFSQLFDGPPRKSEGRITKREMDIARSIQVFTEEAVLRMAKYAKKITGEKNICMAGGVALNCVANGKLLSEGIFDNIWIQPAAGDAGGALGCALDAYYTYFNRERELADGGKSIQGGSYWGPDFSDNEVRAFLETYGYPFQTLNSEERSKKIAVYLNKGKVIGHFAGRMEFGPRALGSRSIIGDARNREMQVTINLKIKYRESFRPFAPTVLAEKVSEYFEMEGESPYMLLVAPVKKERQLQTNLIETDNMLEIVRQPRSDIPAITHVDYSARVQTVNRNDHKEYYDVIKAFEDLTGYGVIVNTSFNVRGEPIVCTPYDAYRCFMRTEMDILVMNNYILFKEDQPHWPEEKGHIDEYPAVKTFDKQKTALKAYKNIYKNDFSELYNSASFNYMKFQNQKSTWENVKSTEITTGVFPIPNSLDSTNPDPKKMSSAITNYWRNDIISTKFEKILTKLLSIKYSEISQDKSDYSEDKEISDSVYVMY